MIPVCDRYDGVNMTTLDEVLRRMIAQYQGITILDTGAGNLGDFWQIVMLCNT